jgi:hypothetical protein
MSGVDRSSEFEIRAIRLNEARAAAAMHFEFFGGPEVTRWSMLKLGSKFLETVFYRLNLDNPHFFALGAFMGGELVGLQVFTTDRQKLFRHLVQRHGLELLFRVLQVTIDRPLVLFRYMIAKAPLFKPEIPDEVQRIPAVLLLMLVRPEVRTKSFLARTGIWVGGELMEAMERIMREKGCREYWSETTVDNSFVHNLARRIGARCVGEARRQGVLLRFIVAPVPETASKRVRRGR